jgi:excisionase family DNA binding protein
MATEVLTTRAVAERFGVAISTVTRWVADGRLTPMVKTPGLRGMYLFTADEVDRFAHERAA